MAPHVKSALVLIAAFVLAATGSALAESHVRIVRLSYLSGQVQTDRATGEGLERAVLNTPITQGVRIVTGNDGLAEVEFENGSAVRIAENSEVQFLGLSMNDNGAKINTVEVAKGVIYLDARSKGDDIYSIKTGGSTFLVQRDAQFRLESSPGQAHLSVFKGNVELADQPQMVNVKHKETLTLDPANPSQYKVVAGAEPLPADAWNREREAYQEAYNTNPGNPGPKSGYGLQDLNYYGNFFMANGYGYVWQPYGFANSMMGWDPYSYGAWAFTPGLGYAFASQYPWGWLPFHYGSWAFLGGGVGWAWVPGGGYGNGWYYNRFQTTPVVTKPPAGWTAPTPPIVTAAQSVRPTVMVKSANATPYIANGRLSPAFSSVIHGRAVGAPTVGRSFSSPAIPDHAVNEHVFAARYNAFGGGHAGQAGHVFAVPAPAPMAVMASPMAVAPSYGGGVGRGVSAVGAASPHASGGHASGGGGGHR